MTILNTHLDRRLMCTCVCVHLFFKATLENVVSALGIPPGMPYTARPIVFRPSTSGDTKLGATIITFEQVADVSRVFNNLSTSGEYSLCEPFAHFDTVLAFIRVFSCKAHSQNA